MEQPRRADEAKEGAYANIFYRDSYIGSGNYYAYGQTPTTNLTPELQIAKTQAEALRAIADAIRYLGLNLEMLGRRK